MSGSDKLTDLAAALPTDYPNDLDALLPTVYNELHDLAKAVLQRRRPFDHTRTTSLIHDVYVRLAGGGVKFRDRSHFLCLAARAMRMVLIDRARRMTAAKRGGATVTLLPDHAVSPAIDGPQLLSIDDSLTKLAAFDERKARIVELRFFGGLSVEETGEAIGLSRATVTREWTLARAWLFRELSDCSASTAPRAGTSGDGPGILG